MTDLLINVFNFFLEFVFFSIWGFALTQQKRPERPVRFLVLVPVFSFAGGLLELMISEQALVTFLDIFLLGIFYWLVVERKISDTVVLTLLSYSVVIVLQIALILVFTVLPVPADSAWVPLIGNLLTIVISLVLAILVPLHKFYDFLLRRNTLYMLFFINVACILYVISLFYKVREMDFSQLILSLAIPLMLLVWANICIWAEYQKTVQQKKLLDGYNQYIPLIEDMINEIRMKQHNYDNIITSLKALPDTCKDYTSLVREIEKYTETAKHGSYDKAVLGINYRLVAGFLNSKLNDARNKGYRVITSISTSVLQTVVPEYELVEILGILFDNMIEACPQEEACYLSLSTEQNKIIIETKNLGPQLNSKMREDFFTEGYSTKFVGVKKRGYGLPMLLSMVNRYAGRVYLDNEYDLEGRCNVVFQVIV